MAARVRSEELANELTEEQKKKIGKEIDALHEEIKKKIAETESEIERKALIEAQKALTKAQEKEIVELLPYRILLTQAQTQREKADAALKFVQYFIDSVEQLVIHSIHVLFELQLVQILSVYDSVLTE